MRFPNSHCLFCRHRVLLRPSNTPRTALALIASQPASSLSAIHDGLRQSQKSRPQGFDKASLNTSRPRGLSQGSRRGRDGDWVPPSFKIKKGKKDITDTGPRPKSRRSRFNDPDDSFGKRSFVKQMKHGDLRRKMSELQDGDRGRNTRFSRPAPDGPVSSADFMNAFESSGGRPGKPGPGGQRDRAPPTRGGRPAEREPRASSTWGTKTRDTERMGERTRDRNPSVHGQRSAEREPRASSAWGAKPRDTERGGQRTRERTWRADTPSSDTRHKAFGDSSSFGNRRASFGDKPGEPSGFRSNYGREARGVQGAQGVQGVQGVQGGRRADDGPIRVHHTTAASQFLYGRSVVEAALKDSRRQLYHLYIYSGNDRRNVAQDAKLTQLARQKGVQCTPVGNEGLPMMDKMSDGRPHNGCVLEASPLPQLPLKALGALSEDPEKPGFHVEVAHQSSEEAKINGTSEFIGYKLPKGRHPFVLLLDGILDPGNLGAILRTAAFLGVNAIAITTGASATLTAVALKASAGASEVATLFSVSSAADFLSRSKEKGWLVYAAVPATKRPKANSHLTVDRVETYDPLATQPTVLVVGSEGEGLATSVRRLADHEVSIPSPTGFQNVVDSLNVSVATGILCSAFLKKQGSGVLDIEEPAVVSEGGNAQLF